jgi:hypothetical protein
MYCKGFEMKRDIFLLCLFFLPATLRGVLFGIAANNLFINEVVVIKYENYLYLFGNITPFTLGLFMLIKPTFFVNILSKMNTSEKQIPSYSVAIFRILGLIFLIASITSSKYFLTQLI